MSRNDLNWVIDVTCKRLTKKEEREAIQKIRCNLLILNDDDREFLTNFQKSVFNILESLALELCDWPKKKLAVSDPFAVFLVEDLMDVDMSTDLSAYLKTSVEVAFLWSHMRSSISQFMINLEQLKSK